MPCLRCSGGAWECGPDQTQLCQMTANTPPETDWDYKMTQMITAGIWFVKLTCQGQCDVDIEMLPDTTCGWRNVGMIPMDVQNAGNYKLYTRKNKGECEFRMEPA